VWVNSASVSCQTPQSCFPSCYREPTVRNDLLPSCSNNFVYLNCGKLTFICLFIIKYRVSRSTNYMHHTYICTYLAYVLKC